MRLVNQLRTSVPLLAVRSATYAVHMLSQVSTVPASAARPLFSRGPAVGKRQYPAESTTAETCLRIEASGAR